MEYFIDLKKLSLNNEGRGYKINAFVAMLIMPILGLAFLMFLPAIGFYLCAEALVIKSITVFQNIAGNHVPVAGEAHLTGHGSNVSNTCDSTDIRNIAKEIQERRNKN